MLFSLILAWINTTAAADSPILYNEGAASRITFSLIEACGRTKKYLRQAFWTARHCHIRSGQRTAWCGGGHLGAHALAQGHALSRWTHREVSAPQSRPQSLPIVVARDRRSDPRRVMALCPLDPALRRHSLC